MKRVERMIEKLDYWAWLLLYRFGRRYKEIRREEHLEVRKYALRDNQWSIREWNRTNIQGESRFEWWSHLILKRTKKAR